MVRRALTAASGYHPQLALQQRSVGEKYKTIFENLERQFVSNFDVQETPYGYKPKFAPRLIVQICARKRIVVDNLIALFFWKGEGKSKIN